MISQFDNRLGSITHAVVNVRTCYCMLRNHISQIMMYGKFLQLFSRPSGHIVRRRYVKKYLINLNGRKGTGDHSEGGRRMMSLFDNVTHLISSTTSP